MKIYLQELKRLGPSVAVFTALLIIGTVLKQITTDTVFVLSILCGIAMPFVIVKTVFGYRFDSGGNDLLGSVAVNTFVLYCVKMLAVFTACAVCVLPLLISGYQISGTVTVLYFEMLCSALFSVQITKTRSMWVFITLGLSFGVNLLVFIVNSILQNDLHTQMTVISLPSPLLYLPLAIIGMFFGQRTGKAFEYISVWLIAEIIFILFIGMTYDMGIYAAAISTAVILSVMLVIDRNIRGVLKSIPIAVSVIVIGGLLYNGIIKYVNYCEVVNIIPEQVENVEFYDYTFKYSDSDVVTSNDNTVITALLEPETEYSNRTLMVHFDTGGLLPVVRSVHITEEAYEKIEGATEK